MAKRFIDSELFKDEWFIELSQDSKLFWIYYITNCDHAGVLKFSPKHIQFCTGIVNLQTVIKELANRLVTVREGLYWMPNFIKFQYPNFPNTKMKAAVSAFEILTKLNIDLNSYLTVSQQLPNSYGNGNGIGNCNGNGVLPEKNILQYPNFETAFDLTALDIASSIEINHRATGQKPTEKDIDNWFYIFKQVNFTGQKFYENRTEIVKHFKNWVKSQKLQSNGKSYAANGNGKIDYTKINHDPNDKF